MLRHRSKMLSVSLNDLGEAGFPHFHEAYMGRSSDAARVSRSCMWAGQLWQAGQCLGGSPGEPIQVLRVGKK
jgi:hypothetical protein